MSFMLVKIWNNSYLLLCEETSYCIICFYFSIFIYQYSVFVSSNSWFHEYIKILTIEFHSTYGRYTWQTNNKLFPQILISIYYIFKRIIINKENIQSRYTQFYHNKLQIPLRHIRHWSKVTVTCYITNDQLDYFPPK